MMKEGGSTRSAVTQRDAGQERTVLRSSPRFFAPDWADRMRSIPAGAWLLIAVFVAVLVAHDPRHAQLPVALSMLAAIIGGPTAFKFLNTRVVLTPEWVEARNALRWTRRCARIDLRRIVVIRIQVMGPRFLLTRVLLLDGEDHVRLSLQLDAWSDEMLGRIYRAVALPVTDQGETVSPWQANRRYPGATSIALRLWPVMTVGAFAIAFILVGALVSITRA